MNTSHEPWYKEGLKFKCTECGKCCSGAPGYVWLSVEEIEEIAKYLEMSIQDFTLKYIRKVNGRFSLVEKRRKEEYDCIFLKEKKCTIYPVRPSQCKTFPWWPQNLNSKKEWQELAKSCEGVREDGDLVSFERIQKQLSIKESND